MTAMVIHVDENGTVVLRCPFCNKSRREPIANLPKNVSFKTECSCGGSYETMIDVRKFFRKGISFKSLISRIEPSGFSETVVIENLSPGGCGFQASARHGLQIGNVIEIRFKTSSDVKPTIWKKAIVRFVKDRYIGCEFVASAGNTDKDFGFYFWKL